MNSGYYSGIGSRETTIDIRQLMTEIAMHFNQWGYTLRTGSGSAADRAFETGAGSNKEIYVPWNGWNELSGIDSLTPDSSELARKVWEHRIEMGWVDPENPSSYGKWEDLHPGTRGLLAKTMCIILGRNLNLPSDTLICWTPGCRIGVGLSAHPIALATIARIPVFNLADPETEDIMRIMLRENRDPLETIANRRTRCERGLEIYGGQLA